MRKIITILALTLFALPSVSFATALTQQQSSSLIAVVQSSPGTPASAFVSLITAFSNITVTQATSLITVVQAAPSVPANAFIDLLTSFTEDTLVAQSTTPATTSIDVCTNIEGIQTAVPGGMTATGNVCIAMQVNTPTPTSTQQTTAVESPNMEGVTILDLGLRDGYRTIKIIVKNAQGKIIGDGSETVRISVDGQFVKAGTAGEDEHPVYDIGLNQGDGKDYNFPATSSSKIEVIYKGTTYVL